jgi:hypothetical protein
VYLYVRVYKLKGFKEEQILTVRVQGTNLLRIQTEVIAAFKVLPSVKGPINTQSLAQEKCPEMWESSNDMSQWSPSLFVRHGACHDVHMHLVANRLSCIVSHSGKLLDAANLLCL